MLKLKLKQDHTIRLLQCVLAFTTTAMLLFAYIALTINNNKMEAVYKQYNHIKIYEDGSYIGQDRKNITQVGCITNAPCND